MTEENDKMKDLLIKLQILTNGLVEERKKSKNYLEKIKDLEKILQQKDNEVVELTKQKFDLQASLTFEKSKKPAKTNKKKNIDERQISQYEEIINEQGFRLRDLNRKLKNEKETFDQQKEQFQTLIQEQSNRIKDLQQKYEKAIEENKELNINNEINSKKITDLNNKQKNYDKIFQEYQNDKVKVQNKNVELQNQLDSLRKENYEKDEKIKELEKKNLDMGVQLNDMKNNLLNKKLSTKTFKVEMIKTKKVIEIKFQQNKEEDKYEMVIKGKNKKDNEEYINLLDINEFKIDNKDKCKVDIDYTVR